MRSRIVPVVLLCACLTGLAACNDAETEAGPAPTTAASAPAAAASSAPLAGSSAAGTNVTSDKEVCETLNKAGSTMKTSITNAQKADGNVAAADAKAAFAKFHKTATEALLFAADTRVTTAARAVADEVAKAAADADPIATAADSGFAELSGNLTTACKTAGVTINF